MLYYTAGYVQYWSWSCCRAILVHPRLEDCGRCVYVGSFHTDCALQPMDNVIDPKLQLKEEQTNPINILKQNRQPKQLIATLPLRPLIHSCPLCPFFIIPINLILANRPVPVQIPAIHNNILRNNRFSRIIHLRWYNPKFR